MARSIVERIKAERRAHQSAAEGFAGDRPPGEAERPANASGEDFVSSFSSEVIPAIGQAIAEAIGSSLDKVSLELVTRLEQALARSAPGAGARALARKGFLEDLDKRDTDLDMPADDVVREIDRVLSEFGPVESRPIQRPESAVPGPGTAFEAKAESETEALDLPPKGGGDGAPGGALATPEAVNHTMGRPAGSSVSTDAPAAVPATDSPAAGLPPDLGATLAPAIAEGISQFAEDVEKGQERIVDAIHRLKARVAVIEGEMRRVAERLSSVAALLLQEEQNA